MLLFKGERACFPFPLFVRSTLEHYPYTVLTPLHRSFLPSFASNIVVERGCVQLPLLSSVLPVPLYEGGGYVQYDGRGLYGLLGIHAQQLVVFLGGERLFAVQLFFIHAELLPKPIVGCDDGALLA